MNFRYLVISFAATAVLSIAVELFIMTLLANNNAALAGAALIAGWWTNVATAATVAIMAGRKAAARFIDPRYGRVAGLSIGAWVGGGAILGLVAATLVLMGQVPNGDIRPGLIVVFGLISLGMCLIAGSIAGRETAHPPEAEEES